MAQGVTPILVQQYRPGGTKSALGLTAAGAVNTVVSSIPLYQGDLNSVVVIAAGSAGSWQICDTNFLGAYSSTTSYVVGQAVSSGGSNYWCILASLGNAVTNATYWSSANTPPANQVLWNPAYNAAGIVLGARIALEAPVFNGIFLSLVPSAGSPQINVFFS